MVDVGMKTLCFVLVYFLRSDSLKDIQVFSLVSFNLVTHNYPNKFLFSKVVFITEFVVYGIGILKSPMAHNEAI